MSSRGGQRWLVLGVVLIIAAAVGIGWMQRDRFLPAEVGRAAPEFQAQTLDGQRVALADLRGDVVLLNIWATWCPPCRAEMPSMQRLYETLGPEGLRVVAVSVDAPAGAFDFGGRRGGDVAAFARTMGLEFDIWHDPTGDIQSIYRTVGIPESYVLDRDGTIVKKVVGATEWDSEANIALFRRLLQS